MPCDSNITDRILNIKDTIIITAAVVWDTYKPCTILILIWNILSLKAVIKRNAKDKVNNKYPNDRKYGAMLYKAKPVGLLSVFVKK